VSLSEEEEAPEVGFKDKIPVFPSHLESWLAYVAAGVVDQDVDLAGLFPCPGGGFADAFLLADIEGDGPGLASERLDFGLGFHEGAFPGTAGDDEVSSSAGEGEGEPLAKAAAGSTDKSGLSREIKRGRGHGRKAGGREK
jgi:hypothetical protein